MAKAAQRLRDHAYSSFREKLLARDIVPGQFVSQRELVELTGMPLGAIREAIPRLEADGLIATVPNRGLQVLSIDLKLIRDAFQLRRMIELEAFAAYCDTAPAEQIERFEQEHRQTREQAVAGVSDEMLRRAQLMDWAFHDAVIDALDNRIISEIHRVNATKIRLIRNSGTRMLPELVVSVMDEHLEIITALAARSKAGVLEAAAAHIESAKRRALDV